MKTLLLVLSVCAAFAASAQRNEQAFDWAINTGGAGDNVKKMVYNAAGDLFVLGQARDTAAFGNVVIGAPKVSTSAGVVQYLGKRTAGGTYSVLYTTYYQPSTGSSIVPTDFCIDNSNNIYLIGTASTLPPNTANFGNGLSVDSNCFFVARLNASGVPQWVKKLRLGTNFTGFTDPLNVGLFPNGDVLFMAQSANSGPNGSQPVRFVRLSSSGAEVWQREYFFKNAAGGPLSYFADRSSINGFVMDANGNFYLKYRTINDKKIVINSDTVLAAGTAGAFSFFCAFNANGHKKYYKGYNAGIGDLAVEKATGHILMSYVQQNANPAPFNTLPLASTLTPVFSGLVVVDSLFGFVKSSQSTIAGSNLFVVPASIYPLGNDKAISTLKYCKNDVLAAGTQSYTNSSGTVFAWKETDQNCVPLYAIAEPVISGNCNTPGGAIAVNGNKASVCGVWAAGTSITINTTTLTANNKNPTPTSTVVSSDAFIAQFDRSLQGGTNPGTVTAVSFPEAPDAGVSIFPNPNQGTFTIAVPETWTGADIRISDLLGREVYAVPVQAAHTAFDLLLERGIYLVQIRKGAQTVTRKISIQ